MLHLYHARENLDKERFLYDHITSRAFVLVPNQYSAVAEEQAFRYLEKDCLFDVEILPLQRLERRILTEKGLEAMPVLDRYGRYLLLYKIIRDRREELEIFRKSSRESAFVAMVNDFISQFKQQDCSAEKLGQMIDDEETPELLRKKLTELRLFYEDYEKAIDGLYTDSEDLIDRCREEAKEVHLLDGREVWVYGFDTIMPKQRDILLAIASRAEVHVIINDGDSAMGDYMTHLFRRAAEEEGIPCSEEAIPNTYLLKKSEAVRYLEKHLFVRGKRTEEAHPDPEILARDIVLTECANAYDEAETVAANILHLLRDKEYRMKDIAVICNDQEAGQPLLRRVFGEYGIPIFVDARRGISDSAAAVFLVSLLEFILYPGHTDSLMTLLKTGLTDLSTERVEKLENYSIRYRIRGTMWERPFKYGASEYDEDAFAELEDSRVRLTELLSPLLRAAENREQTVAEWTKTFKNYLDEVWHLRERLAKRAASQEEKGYPEEAEFTAQCYDTAMHIFDQIVGILGDEPYDPADYLDLVREGMNRIAVGLIPPAPDGISLGTLIRTRTAPVRAIFLVQTNEGILPKEPPVEGLFSVDEKAYFTENAFPLGSLDDIKMMEENAALYRVVSKPQDRLYISWSLQSVTGDSSRPSFLVDDLKTLLPELPIHHDILSRGFTMDLVNAKLETLRHFMNYLKDHPENAEDEALTEDRRLAYALLRWFEEHDDTYYPAALEAACDENEAAPVSPSLIHRLYAGRDGNFSFSPSRLEKFDHCPFAHYITYGLRPEEEREYAGDPRSVGDVYHATLMGVSKRLLKAAGKPSLAKKGLLRDGAFDASATSETEGTDVSAESSAPEMPSLEKLVEEELVEAAGAHRDGLFLADQREKYHLRRIYRVCLDAVRVLAKQFSDPGLLGACFEEKFGRGGVFPPIECRIGENKVCIEGKIDRVDLLQGDGIRVIDYKTGHDVFDREQMRSGYKMQLMVYMKGALEADSAYEPAGLFYFNIAESMENIGNAKGNQEEFLESKEKERFRLNGAYIDEPQVLDSMPASMLGKTGEGFSREDFRQLADDVGASIERLSRDILSGRIDILPTKVVNASKTRGQKACTYCQYKSICRFDPSNGTNHYRNV